MKNCELFFVRGGDDFEKLSNGVTAITESLLQKNINVAYQTNVVSGKDKIEKALDTSIKDDSLDLFIFANALTTKDSKSLESLFLDFITKEEEKIEIDEENKGKTPKIKVTSLGDLGNGYKGYAFIVNKKRFIVLPRASLCKKDNLSLINEVADKAEEVFEKIESTTVDGITYLEETKKKEGFFSSLFPQKTDTGKVKGRKIAVLIAMLALVVAIGYLIDYFIIAPALNNKVNAEIQEVAYGSADIDTLSKGQAQDWEALKKINDEIVGWIKIDDTVVDYPVLEHEGDSQDGQYYLYRNYKEEWSVYGTCFIDYRSTDSVNSKNVIIHGHNMNDGSMFHELMNYGDLWGDLDYYKEHPVITFNTPEGDAKWKIISVFKTNTLYQHGEFFNYMQGTFNSDAEFMNFVYNCKIRSVFNTPVMINENDQLLTLSTCSYEFSNFRTVVVARKVRDGESEDVDVNLATKQTAVYPDVYYERYGGERPTIYTFSKAYKKGLVSWYDGKGNLKGDETLTGTVAANPTDPPPETTKDGKVKKETQPQSVTFFTVNFLNYDGSIYESHSVQQGSSIGLPSSDPSMPSDDYYDYVFTGWQTDGMDLDNVQYSMDIAPNFEAVEK